VKQLIQSAPQKNTMQDADDDLCTCQSYDMVGESSNWREELRSLPYASLEDQPSDMEISSEGDEPEPEKNSSSTHKEASK